MDKPTGIPLVSPDMQRNFTALNTIRALGALAHQPQSCPELASNIGVETRTARRLVYTLRDLGLVEQGLGTYRKRYYVARPLRELGLALVLAPMSDGPARLRGYEAMRAAHRAALSRSRETDSEELDTATREPRHL